MSSKEMFTKIQKSDDKLRLIKKFLDTKESLLVIPVKKNEGEGEIFNLMPIQLYKDKVLISNNDKLEVQPDSQFIIQFLLQKEKYLIFSKLEKTSDGIYLYLNTDFFKLQRRDDPRMDIPKSYSPKVQLIKYNSEVRAGTFEMLNISSGGCQIQCEQSEFDPSINAPIEAKLLFHGRSSITFAGVILHIQGDLRSKERKSVGIQFTFLSEREKQKLSGIILDIYKRILIN